MYRAKSFISIIPFSPLLIPKTRDHMDSLWYRRKLKVTGWQKPDVELGQSSSKPVRDLFATLRKHGVLELQPLKKEAQKRPRSSTQNA